MSPAVGTARRQKRRALAHQCPTCRRHWALHVVDHAAGGIVVCRYCSALRTAERLPLGVSPG